MQIVARTLTSVAALVLIPVAAATVCAQQSLPITPPQSIVRGDHIRLYQSASDTTPIVGRVRTIGTDSIGIVPDEDSTVRVLLTRRDVARIEVERDARLRDHVVTFMAAVGAFGGAGLAAYQCLSNREECAYENDAAQRAAANGDTYVDTSLLLIAGGGLAGALLGYVMAPAPHWDVIAFPTRTASLDGVSRWGLSLGMRYRFNATMSSGRRRVHSQAFEGVELASRLER